MIGFEAEVRDVNDPLRKIFKTGGGYYVRENRL
jgi:hypothetical protein